jgi:hypothetical protein
MGIICLLIAQQKIERSHRFRRQFSMLQIFDKETVSVPWLVALYVMVFLDHLFGDSHDSIINNYPVFEELYALVVIIFCAIAGLSIVWIASRKLYLTYKQWRMIQPGSKRDSILCRGILVVGLSLGIWFLCLESGQTDIPSVIVICGTVEVCLMGASVAGIVWALLWVRAQDWSSPQNVLEHHVEENDQNTSA